MVNFCDWHKPKCPVSNNNEIVEKGFSTGLCDTVQPNRAQFHQRSTSSFYVHRFQKRKKDSQVKHLFVLAGSERVKAARKHVDEIDLSYLMRMQNGLFLVSSSSDV